MMLDADHCVFLMCLVMLVMCEESDFKSGNRSCVEIDDTLYREIFLLFLFFCRGPVFFYFLYTFFLFLMFSAIWVSCIRVSLGQGLGTLL
jgi:hypothetical protein